MTRASNTTSTPATQTTLTLPSGAGMPRLGLGTWHMAEGAAAWDREIAALQAGLQAGLRLIDTAEMYAGGAAERLAGRAIAEHRESAFLVSKLYPWNAGYDACVAACEASLQRLGTDRLDLYLLHWPGQVPYAETLAAFRDLQRAGKIVDYGVSNFDAAELADWCAADTDGGTAVNQVWYSLGNRTIEADLLPACRARGVAVMAYAPLDQGDLPADRRLVEVADRLGLDPAVLALAWLIGRDGVSAIPKTADPARARRFAQACAVGLDAATLADLDIRFPAPDGPAPLAIL
jgi:diketogulonate reductase-like aldo/keto reductase